MTAFAIHALPVGGGTLALSPLPGRGGVYPADLAGLLAWDPALVVSLCEGAEMDRAGAGGLAADLAAGGIPWRHVPVADYGVPGPEATVAWEAVVVAVMTILAQGGRVLFHCHGGCGRSGMAVLRIMIGCGEDKAAALARLRRTRPCAVETEAQYDWACQGPLAGRVG